MWVCAPITRHRAVTPRPYHLLAERVRVVCAVRSMRSGQLTSLRGQGTIGKARRQVYRGQPRAQPVALLALWPACVWLMHCDRALPQMWGMVLQVLSWCGEPGGICKAVLAMDACKEVCIRERVTVPRRRRFWEPHGLCEWPLDIWRVHNHAHLLVLFGCWM